ncbi:MAG: dihydrolipoyl dehydrogenase [Alphaproteobacteria bacterium]|nr:dihydrolipoyl dehydrogenase [Alphaproteobacteria bacterium]
MDYDLIVIGAGPGGYPAAIRGAQLGLKTACIEKEKLGGVCLNWGCIPSKALLKSAELANKIRHAEDFGLKVTGLEADFPAVVARSRKVSQRHERGVAGLFKKYGVTPIFGEATIVAPGKVKVGDQELTCKHLVVATGARAKVFPGIEVDGERVLTYREAIVRDVKPASVTVLGAGAIGLEFAYFWRGMGVEVTVVEGLPEILPREDAEVAKECRKHLEKLGIRFVLGTFVDTAVRKGDGTVVTLKDGRTIEADLVLVALGIVPNSAGFGLEQIGVTLERGFVPVDASMRTNVPGVYAVGDLTTRGGLAHTATRQAEICVERIAGHHVADVEYDDIPSCTYCVPQVASVGLTEEAAKAKGIAYKVGKFPFQANGKAQGAGSPEGFVKILIGDPHGEIVGAHIVGSEATEMIAEFGLARANELTADEILHTVHAHPTYSEAMFEAVAQALGRTVHL